MSKFVQLKNLVCLVAGGAKGLGRATAELLVKNGAQTIVADLPPPITPKEIALKIMAATSDTEGHCIFLPTDITSESKSAATFAEIKSRYGRLDVLVNCAGMASEEMMFNHRTDSVHTLELFQRTLRVNLIGSFNMARLAAQLMARNKPDANGLRGAIVNTASVTAFDSPHGFVAYAASKGGIVSMSLPMARDLADIGIRVVSIAPGDMDTSVYKGMRQSVRAEDRSRYQQLLGRPGRPEEFAHAVRTVIENPYINACVVRLDGADSCALIH